MTKPRSHLIWAPYSISALLGCPAFHVTYGWAHTRSGLGLQSGHGSKRPCPQRTWKAVCAGAVWLDRPPPLALGCRAPGAQGEDSPHWVCGASLACHQRMCPWAIPCPLQTVGPGGWTFPRSLPDKALSAALKTHQLLDCTERR